jgi:hypothetical protein
MPTNKRFVITTTILSRADNATPADVTWYRGEDHAQALAALVSAAAQDPNAHDNNLPESMKYDVTGVRLDIYDIEPECSGRTGVSGNKTVPYCGQNPEGCALHYPSASTSTETFAEVAERQGWNADSRESVMMQYIDGDQATDLPTYAARVAAIENGA